MSEENTELTLEKRLETLQAMRNQQLTQLQQAQANVLKLDGAIEIVEDLIRTEKPANE